MDYSKFEGVGSSSEEDEDGKYAVPDAVPDMQRLRKAIEEKVEFVAGSATAHKLNTQLWEGGPFRQAFTDLQIDEPNYAEALRAEEEKLAKKIRDSHDALLKARIASSVPEEVLIAFLGRCLPHAAPVPTMRPHNLASHKVIMEMCRSYPALHTDGLDVYKFLMLSARRSPEEKARDGGRVGDDDEDDEEEAEDEDEEDNSVDKLAVREKASGSRSSGASAMRQRRGLHTAKRPVKKAAPKKKQAAKAAEPQVLMPAATLASRVTDGDRQALLWALNTLAASRALHPKRIDLLFEEICTPRGDLARERRQQYEALHFAKTELLDEVAGRIPSVDGSGPMQYMQFVIMIAAVGYLLWSTYKNELQSLVR